MRPTKPLRLPSRCTTSVRTAVASSTLAVWMTASNGPAVRQQDLPAESTRGRGLLHPALWLDSHRIRYMNGQGFIAATGMKLECRQCSTMEKLIARRRTE